jgi:hypothetical protein
MTYRLLDGDFFADIDDSGLSGLMAGLDDATREIVAQVERETRQIYDDARAAWPVSPGEGVHSRDGLAWRIDISREQISGRVEAPAAYARYIQSWQIRPGRWPSDPEVRDRRQAAARVNRSTGRGSSPAAQSGSAMWVLLRWPEARAGKDLTSRIGPLIEAALAARVE